MVRVYDESSRKLKVSLEGGGTGEPGHSNRVFAVKFDKEDENLLISGGWDRSVKVWDIRQTSPIRSFFDPYICGDSLDLHEGYILTGSCRTER